MSLTPRQYAVPHLDKKIPVAIVGATGMVGRKFAELLSEHPYFAVQEVAASPHSVGKNYAQVAISRGHDIPRNLSNMNLTNVLGISSEKVRVIFSAFEGTKAEIMDTESELASRGFIVVSNNGAHRWTPDVPMMLPEVNPDHLELLSTQKSYIENRGGIVVKPNCSIQSYVPVLKAWERFGIKKVFVVTEQSISGAGKTFSEWPKMIDNVIPHISGEEEKSEREPLKVLGTLSEGVIHQANTSIQAICTRVASSDGHMANVFVEFEQNPGINVLNSALLEYQNPIAKYDLPSSPAQFMIPMQDPERPQNLLDRDNGHGMSITVGPLKNKGNNTYGFSALSHNTIRGAAGGAVLTAELLFAKGYL